jgi:hypothetical protein
MSTIGEKVSHAAGATAEFIFNPATAAQVVGRDAIAMIIDRAMAVGQANSSLVGYTQAARVEPLCLVDTDALFVEELHDVLQSMQSIFAGYYLQAVQLDSSIGHVKVLETLQKFNPNRPVGSHIGSLTNAVGQTLGHAIGVRQAGHGIGPGALGDSALASAGGLAAGIHHLTAAQEAFEDALPSYAFDSVALEATAPKGSKRQIQVDPAFADDAAFKNWKQHRELARAKQQDQQHRERVNDRRAQKDDKKEEKRLREEDRDLRRGQLQEQANRQKAQDERQAQLDRERAEDRRKQDERANKQDKRQETQEDERKRNQSWQNQRQLQQDAEREADRLKQEQREQAEAASKAADDARVSTSFGSDALREIKEASNLAVGKMLQLEIKHAGQVFQVPVALRLVVNTIPSAQLTHILSLSNEIITGKERFHAWKAGRLEFVKDLIFCRDLVDAHRRNLMKDADSVYARVVKNESKSFAAAILSGVPSVAAASNMIVTTTHTIEEVELSMPGKFSDFHAREKIFEHTSLMIVAVIDKEWNRVTFYHRGIADATEVSFRDLKAAGKGSGPDVSDILKAYTLGNAPRL